MKTIRYGRHWIDEPDRKRVCGVLKSDNITQGPAIKDFEDALCRYTGAKYAVAVSSGTAALHCACMAANIRSGAEVITSPITFAASANCVLYCGGRPVFADVRDDTVNIDSEQIMKRISKRTKAIIPVHFSGNPCDLAEIHSISKKHDLLIIEDAAHALGARYKGSKIGSCKYSDMTVFSFHPVKHITTGEGGAVTTNRKDVYDRILMMRNHGITKERSQFMHQNLASSGSWYYEMQYLGFNYRITDFQCALGMSQLAKLNEFLKLRAEIVSEYNTAFSVYDSVRPLHERKYVKSANHIYVLRFKMDRFNAPKSRIFDDYTKNGISANVHYIPVYRHPYYEKLSYEAGLCPIAEQYYEEAITLPLYPKMSNAEIDKVIAITKEIIERYEK